MKTENNIFKPIFLLMVVFCVVLSMSCVCAANDINDASNVYENSVDFEIGNLSAVINELENDTE